MSDFESTQRSNERELEARTFNDVAENIREEVRTSNWFSEEGKTLILDALNAEYSDFRSETLDKSMFYNGKPIREKTAFFFGERMGAAISRLPEAERESAFQFVKQIISPTDRAE